MTTVRQAAKRAILGLAWAGLAACQREVAPDAAGPGAVGAASTATRWVAARVPSDLSLFEVPAVVRSPGGAAIVLAAPVRARVEQVLVRAGDPVQEGQVVAQLLLPGLVEASAALQAAQTRITAHRRWLQELRSLRGDGLVRQADVFEAEAKVAELQAQVLEGEAQLRAAGLQTADAAALIKGSAWPLRAPAAATVRSVEAEQGAVLDSGDVLVRLVRGGKARIEARLTRPLPASAKLQFVATTGEVVDLAGQATATAIDPADGAVLAWFEPLQPTTLSHGLRGRVRVASVADATVQVPARALLRRDGGAVVLVPGAAGQPPVAHAVEVLLVQGPIALVRGLAAGTVVAAEADRLHGEAGESVGVAPPAAGVGEPPTAVVSP